MWSTRANNRYNSTLISYNGRLIQVCPNNSIGACRITAPGSQAAPRGSQAPRFKPEPSPRSRRIRAKL